MPAAPRHTEFDEGGERWPDSSYWFFFPPTALTPTSQVRTKTRRLGAAGALVSAVAIAALTLVPSTGETTSAICLVCGEYGGVDVILNILLFVPFGIGLRLAGLRPIVALTVGIGLTFTIEVLQTWLVAGRDASLGDLVANTLGAAVGIALASFGRSLLAPDGREARVLLTAGLAAAVGLTALGAWGLQPAPPDEAYYAQWRPQLGQFGIFPGEVVDARLDEEPFPRWRVESGRQLAEAMQSRAVRFSATVAPGAPSARLSPIVSVFDEERREVLILAQEGRDLVFRHRTRLRDARLRSPGVRLENAFPVTALPPGETDTLHVSATLDGRYIQLAARGPGISTSRVVALTPDLWWVAPLPFDMNLGALAGLLSALWVAAVAVPIGYWSAFAGRRAAGLLIGAAVVAVVFAVAAIGGPLPSWWSAAGALVGGTIGCTLGRRRNRRTARVLLPGR